MHAAISSLIAASLLLHAALGCCRHHAHEGLGCTPGVWNRAAETGACCHEHDDPAAGDAGEYANGNSDEHAPAAPCRGDSTCQGVCTYLPPQKSQLQLPLFPTLLAFVPTPCVLAETSQRTSPAWLDALFCTGAAPHVRLHLAQSVLLI